MDYGSIVYFHLSERRRLEEIFCVMCDAIIARPTSGAGGWKEIVIKQFTRAGEQRFPSIEKWSLHLADCQEAVLYVESVDGQRTYAVYARSVDNGFVNVVEIRLSSDLWMPALNLTLGFKDGVLEHSLDDYALCKQLFRRLNAERCLGSCMENYLAIDEPEADEAFLFTHKGPQKLIRPLEEGKAFQSMLASNPEEARDLLYDPGVNPPKWALVVDKPFDELPEGMPGANF